MKQVFTLVFCLFCLTSFNYIFGNNIQWASKVIEYSRKSTVAICTDKLDSFLSAELIDNFLRGEVGPGHHYNIIGVEIPRILFEKFFVIGGNLKILC